jgi:hypothetical protein
MSAFEELMLAIELYHHGEFAEAVDVYDRAIARGGDTSLYQIFRCYTLPELPDGPARTLVAYPGLNLTTVYGMYAPTIPQLLGRRSEALAAYRTLRERLSESPTRPAWVDRLMEFNCGLLAEDDLLRAAGESRLNRCEAHFFIGLARLAEGDRGGAAAHFRRSVETRVYVFVDHMWSVAFLSRLESDPNWPRWVPHLAPVPSERKR